MQSTLGPIQKGAIKQFVAQLCCLMALASRYELLPLQRERMLSQQLQLVRHCALSCNAVCWLHPQGGWSQTLWVAQPHSARHCNVCMPQQAFALVQPAYTWTRCTCHTTKCGMSKSANADFHSTSRASCNCHVQVLMLLEERS